MANSTQLVADMTTVCASTPNSTSLASLSAATGPIQDWQGNAQLILLKLKEAAYLCVKLRAALDSSTPDPIYTTLGNVAATIYASYGNLV